MSDVQVVQKSNPESLSKEKYLGEINILSRKRKLEETSGEGDEKPEVRKKLKWETIQRSKTGLHLEHAIYFKPDETKNFFQSLENEIEYLRYALGIKPNTLPFKTGVCKPYDTKIINRLLNINRLLILVHLNHQSQFMEKNTMFHVWLLLMEIMESNTHIQGGH